MNEWSRKSSSSFSHTYTQQNIAYARMLAVVTLVHLYGTIKHTIWFWWLILLRSRRTLACLCACNKKNFFFGSDKKFSRLLTPSDASKRTSAGKASFAVLAALRRCVNQRWRCRKAKKQKGVCCSPSQSPPPQHLSVLSLVSVLCRLSVIVCLIECVPHRRTSWYGAKARAPARSGHRL